MTRRLQCKDCNVGFLGTHPKAVASLPEYAQETFPAVFSHRGAVDVRDLQSWTYQFQDGLNINTLTKRIRSEHMHEFKRRKLMYISYIETHEKQICMSKPNGVTAEDYITSLVTIFSEFTDTSGYSGFCFSNGYLFSLIFDRFRKVRWSNDLRNQQVSAKSFSCDHSRKLVKLAVDKIKVRYFEAVYMIHNEIEQIVGCVLVCSKAHTEIQPTLRGIARRLAGQGVKLQFVWTDDTSDERLYEEIFPELKEGVLAPSGQSNTTGSGKPAAMLPPPEMFQVHIATTRAEALECTEMLWNHLAAGTQADPLTCAFGFDSEWDLNRQRQKEGKVALLQVSTLTFCIVFNMTGLHYKLPERTKSFFASEKALWVGLKVGQHSIQLPKAN